MAARHPEGVRMSEALLSLPVMVFAALLLASPARPQHGAGVQVLTYWSDVDESPQPYALWAPPNYDPAKKYPLVVSLHTDGSNHILNMRRVLGLPDRPDQLGPGAARWFGRGPNVDYIVASPLARGSMGYEGIAERDVYDVLADVKKHYLIDEDRVYLTGISMGGSGALRLALTRPDVWAAVAAVCPDSGDHGPFAPNALNLPVHLYHGDEDAFTNVEISRQWMKLLSGLDTEVEYTEYPYVRHNAWDVAYRNAGVFHWFDKFRRERFPARVRFTTDAYKYDSAYWVRIDSLDPGTPASIDARFTGDNEIEIQTASVYGFTLTLAGHSKFRPAAPLRLMIDGKPHSVKVQAQVSFARDGPGWKAARYTPAAGEKRPGLEGPIAEAIASRHIYVYGTGDAATPEEIRRREGQAAKAASWSTPQDRLFVGFRSMPDSDVTDADLRSANLVLFGNRITNTLIARFARRLPLELNPSAADYGLVFVAPVDGRYVVVNSGLPWWTDARQANRPGARGDEPFELLSTFGDYILFKGSLKNVVAEGRFDRNWKVPAAEAARLKATGAVNIHE
jgi:pimeloyl-ACP methyl ester carboxylesterase